MSRQRVLPSQQAQMQPQIPLPPSSGGPAPFGNPSDQQQQQRPARRPRTPPSRDQRAQAQFEYEQQRGFGVDPGRPPSPRNSPSKASRQPHPHGERERDNRPPRAARAPPPASFRVDEEAIMKAYNLSTLQPEYWQNTATGEDGSEFAMSPAAGPSMSKKPPPEEHDEADPLGLYRGSILSNVPELSKDVKAKIFTQNKGFDPKAFLEHVHPAAGPDDLAYGREKLKESVESRSGAIQRLVEENFDRFVAIKAATFNVYEEMKLGPLAADNDYSVADLRESLKLAQNKVDAVWNPILEARLKADRLRSTLGVFERSKFFFTLPGVLSESIASGRYDLFLTSYKKGKYLLDSRPGALLGLPPGTVMTEAQREKHGRVFEKVWGQIERIRDDFRDLLVEQLKDPRRDIEGVERNVEILLELDPTSDPVWIFFDTQHSSIKKVLQKSHAGAAAKFEDILSKSKAQEWNDTKTARDLRMCVHSLGTPASDAIIGQAAGHDAWKALADLVHTDCEALLQTIPNFWKVAKAYLDGKYQHKEPNASKGNKRVEHLQQANRRSSSQVRVMTREIILLYISLLSEFFRLSSDTTSPPMAQGQQGEVTGPPLPSFVPPQSGALAAGQYLLKILGELSDCTNEIGGLGGLGTEAQNSLKEFMNAVRWKFTDALCNLWTRDARTFHTLEDWKLDTEDQSRTIYLKHLTSYQRAVARLGYRASGGNEEAASNLFISGTGVNAYSRSIRDQSIPSEFARRIHSAYLDALYLFLDGLVALAFSEPTRLKVEEEQDSASSANQPLSPALKPEEVNVKDRDVRILLAISNLSHFKSEFIAKIVEQLKMALKVDMVQDSKTLNDVVAQLDKILFEEYIKARSTALKATIDSGVLSGIDWYNAPKPTEVRSYIYESLLSLVLVHSQVTAIARSLVARTVGALVEELAKHALQAFSQVQRFGMGGMLQATLEMEFLHQTLNVHVSPAADATLQEIYKIISQAYRPQTGADGSSGELQRELEQLKLTLTQARRATALQFLCFRERRPSVSSAGRTSSENTSPAGSVSSAAGGRRQ